MRKHGTRRLKPARKPPCVAKNELTWCGRKPSKTKPALSHATSGKRICRECYEAAWIIWREKQEVDGVRTREWRAADKLLTKAV